MFFAVPFLQSRNSRPLEQLPANTTSVGGVVKRHLFRYLQRNRIPFYKVWALLEYLMWLFGIDQPW
jgi:hypothetical protein